MTAPDKFLLSRFGESSVTKMVRWSIKNFSPNLPQFAGGGPTILECGCGNGTLLLEYLKPWVRAELREEGGRVYQPGDLTGVDYSEGSVELAKKVEEQRRANGWRGADDDDDEEDDEEISAAEVDDRPVSWRTVDLLRSTLSEQWDLVLDKGTFDALALSSEPVEGDGRLPSVIYPERIAKLVKPGGYFLITCEQDLIVPLWRALTASPACNFTEEEVKRRFEQGGLRYQ